MSISSSGRRGLGRRSGMVEDGGDGCGGGRRRWMGCRTAAMDGVVDGGWCGDGVLAWMVYERENGGRSTGNHVFGTRMSGIWESYKLSPRLKFGRLVGWG